MKLFVLFGQRKQRYDGEFGPEALVCWDEFCVDENPGGFEEACACHIAARGGEFSSTRVIEIRVDGDKIAKLLNKNPVVEGEVK